MNVNRKEVYLNLIMEYIPDTLSKIIKNNYLNKEFLSNQKIKMYTKELLLGLKDLHVNRISFRNLISATEILSLPTYLLQNKPLSTVILGLLNCWAAARRISLISVRGIIELHSCCSELLSTILRSICGLEDALLQNYWRPVRSLKAAILLPCWSRSWRL